jgi:cobalamin synthase
MLGVTPQRPQINTTEHDMHLNLSLTPLVSLLAGIIILIVPRMLNFIVAAYLIIIGLIGLFGNGSLHLH